MKQEDKELLLKDLSARLLYGVICTDSRHGDSEITEIDTVAETVYCNDFDEYVELNKCKPYLRPMSSMTDEEIDTYHSYCDCNDKDFNGQVLYFDTIESLDYLNSIHVDYRNLIPKGLAIEAPEGMYGKKE